MSRLTSRRTRAFMTDSQPPAEFLRLVEAQQIAFDPGDLDRLGSYLDRLEEANRRFNLTAITDRESMWVRHIADSLTLLPLLASVQAKRVVDVGSGGGLPGIPLAIAMPEAQVTLVESTGKKVRFLEQTAEALGLSNVTVVQERAETLAHRREYREAFDAAVARAVGKLPVLLELTMGFLRVGGFLFAVKGERAGEEIEQSRQAAHLLHCHIAETHRTETGTIVVVEKLRRSPKIYPRRPGEPNRAPLGGKAVKQALSEPLPEDEHDSVE